MNNAEKIPARQLPPKIVRNTLFLTGIYLQIKPKNTTYQCAQQWCNVIYMLTYKNDTLCDDFGKKAIAEKHRIAKKTKLNSCVFLSS